MAFIAGTGGLARIVPSGFLPNEDQGAFMGEIQLPDAASTSRTLAVVEQVEGIVRAKPWLQNLFTVSGYSMLDGLSLPNRAFFVAAMKPFDERKGPDMSVFAALAQLNQDFRRIAAATIIPFNLPPIIGLSTSAGFEFQLVSRTGASPTDMAATARGLVTAAQSVPELAGVYTTYGAASPQIYLDLDRERAQVLGVDIAQVFDALQTAMGGYYANDFNLFGRTWQVKVQAEASDRRIARDVYRVRIRNASGELIPLRAVAEIRVVTAPSQVIRYNNLRSVTINGGPAPGYLLWSGDGCHGSPGEDDASGRLWLPMDGHRLSGESGVRPDWFHSGARPPVCVTCSSVALYESTTILWPRSCRSRPGCWVPWRRSG